MNFSLFCETMVGIRNKNSNLNDWETYKNPRGKAEISLMAFGYSATL